jgi:putative effector of murein hydrolase LrgA (UPF0299 family)
MELWYKNMIILCVLCVFSIIFSILIHDLLGSILGLILLVLLLFILINPNWDLLEMKEGDE